MVAGAGSPRFSCSQLRPLSVERQMPFSAPSAVIVQNTTPRRVGSKTTSWHQ